MKRPPRERGADVFELEVGGEMLVVVSAPVHEPELDQALTAVEREIALDVAAGRSNAAIARKRKRSVRTIANQLASIYRKLGIASRAELAARLHGHTR